MNISSGPAKIIDSGTVIAFSENPVEIGFSFRGNNLKLIFDFKEKIEAVKEPSVEGHSEEDGKALRLTLFNFNNPLGTGSTKPEPIGKFDSTRLYLHYRIYTLEGGDRTIHYTIYSVEEPTNVEVVKEEAK